MAIGVTMIFERPGLRVREEYVPKTSAAEYAFARDCAAGELERRSGRRIAAFNQHHRAGGRRKRTSRVGIRKFAEQHFDLALRGFKSLPPVVVKVKNDASG